MQKLLERSNAVVINNPLPPPTPHTPPTETIPRGSDVAAVVKIENSCRLSVEVGALYFSPSLIAVGPQYY